MNFEQINHFDIVNNLTIETFHCLVNLLMQETRHYIKYDIISMICLCVLIFLSVALITNIIIFRAFRFKLFKENFKTLFPVVISLYIVFILLSGYSYNEKRNTEKIIKSSIEKMYNIYHFNEPRNIKMMSSRESFLNYSNLISRMFRPNEEFRQKFVKSVLTAEILEPKDKI